VTIEFTEKEFSVNLEHPGLASTIKVDENEVLLQMNSGTVSAVRMKKDGTVEFQDKDGTYSLKQIIDRINQLSAAQDLDDL
jgi:hypothetical protein